MFTQEEVNLLEKFAVTKSLKNTAENGNVLVFALPTAWINGEQKIVITADSLEKAFQQVKDRLQFKSPAQVASDAQTSRLTPQEHSEFVAWMRSRGAMKGGLDNSTDEKWYENAAHILRGAKFKSTVGFDVAMQQNVFGKLHFPKVVQGEKRGHQPVEGQKTGQFFESSAQERARLAAEKEAAEAAAAQAAQPQPEQTAWERITRDAVKNARNVSTHGRQEAIRTLMEQAEATGQWMKFGGEIRRLLKTYEMVGS